MSRRPHAPDAVLDGRTAAALAIQAALYDDAFVADCIRAWRREGRIDPREANLATEIGLGVIRRLPIIERVLRAAARYEPHRVRPEIRTILLVGAYQLLYLDRIPDYAIVSEAVRSVRESRLSRAAGMVNAVLRNLVRALETRRCTLPVQDAESVCADPRLTRAVRLNWNDYCVLTVDAFPAPQPGDAYLRYVAAATGEHFERLRALAAIHGASVATQTAWTAQATPPVVVQRNPLRVDAAAFVAAMRAIDADAEFDDEAAATCAFLSPGSSILDSACFLEGQCWVQDTTARLACRHVAAKAGERIADWCAAPGGKTVALCIDAADKAALLALDVSEQRLLRVADNIARMQLRGVECRPHGLPVPKLDARGLDATLVDVPCSNTGVFARRPEARLHLNAKTLESLVTLQREILTAAAKHVRPGGRLVYSTCSIEPQENAEQIAHFATSNFGWTVETSEFTAPRWGPRKADWRDGGFVARLRYK
ncbi:MAG: hypothetical protein HZB38_19550 [Planctomycetes bacterium]|nr:hypothetical protein [Planctomycetota bacterium]